MNSAKGAPRLVADALVVAKNSGVTGMVTVCFDSAFYNHGVIAAVRRGGARFSVTARMDKAVTRAINQIDDKAWVVIKYPKAVWDDEQQRRISDAEVAEIPFNAFTSWPKGAPITARLIVRRVKRLNPPRPRPGRVSCSPTGVTTPCSPTPH